MKYVSDSDGKIVVRSLIQNLEMFIPLSIFMGIRAPEGVGV